MQLVERPDVASDEDVEGEAPSFLVRLVRIGRVHDHGRKQADVIGLRPVAPTLAVVEIERIHVEIERRWLVDLEQLGELTRYARREIEDLYISDSRLRLRKVCGPADDVTFKLGKKYGKRTPLSEPITNLYLTEHEYGQLSSLPGSRTRKHRCCADHVNSLARLSDYDSDLWVSGYWQMVPDEAEVALAGWHRHRALCDACGSSLSRSSVSNYRYR